FTGAAQAALLGFTQTKPRVEGSGLQVDYGSGTPSFTASGFCDVLRKADNPDALIPNGSFSMTGNVTSAGVGNGGYSLLVTDGNGNTLYRGNALTSPTRIGTGVEDKFDFEFVQQTNVGDTGALVPNGTPLGVQLDGRNIPNFNNPNPPVFTSGFSNDGAGFFYVFPVPEPGSALLCIMGTAAV